MELISHKVTTNIKLANTEPHVVRVLYASSYNIFINKPKHVYFVYICIDNYLINIINSLMLNSKTSLKPMPK